MTIRERLRDFASSIAVATTDPPDDYAYWSGWTYETHMADIKGLWAEIRPQLKRDLEQAELIEGKLQEMFAAFDVGETGVGRKAAMVIYNMKVDQLK
jgi:hypothetical protein